LRVGQFGLPQTAIARKSLCLDRAHHRSP
jgi:hypothetical protein